MEDRGRSSAAFTPRRPSWTIGRRSWPGRFRPIHQGQSVGTRLRHRSRPGLRLLSGDGRGGAKLRRVRANRFCRWRRPITRTSRLQRLRRSRLQRHVRQADDVRSGPGRRAGPKLSRRRASSSRVTHNYTGYPLVRQARDMILIGRSWGRSTRFAPIISKAGCGRGWRTRSRNRPTGAPTRCARRGRLVRRHRHARLQSGPLHDRPDAGSGLLHPEDLNPAVSSTITARR